MSAVAFLFVSGQLVNRAEARWAETGRQNGTITSPAPWNIKAQMVSTGSIDQSVLAPSYSSMRFSGLVLMGPPRPHTVDTNQIRRHPERSTMECRPRVSGDSDGTGMCFARCWPCHLPALV